MQEQAASAVEAATNTIASAAPKVTYVSAGASVAAYAASIDWAVWFSVFIGVITFFTTLYFKRREDKRAQEIHELEKKAWLEKINAKQD
ncbi:phage holin [Acinetobacter genomosp. 15BJ]|uniref:Holin n=1 Tax=Acinetobacter genomosp. 15BJ TaxID=106651 RepID=A0ABT8V389_9GAMM|nr:holin [Acinetobacter genomosp. 15BJ]MDO3658369.1 holin [Acinetobacter genomosp. 15BJ]